MTIDFVNLVKGRVTQTLLAALFERGGYRVTRFGIEEILDEIKLLDLQQYLALGLPHELRTLPDLLVVELDVSHAFLVEVKYRRSFDDTTAASLHDELTHQHEYWPTTYTVLMISQPLTPDRTFHQDYIRVLAPNQTGKLVAQGVPLSKRWEDFHHLQRVFKRFNNPKYIYDVQKSADRLTTTLRDLANL